MQWSDLRNWEGSQFTAFEELCCQLAACEEVPNGARFIRKGAPDAGVECFWMLPSGEEWAWQAKFFRDVPDTGQWRQLDGSVRTAIAKHPRLTVYTICIPQDRQDPRIDQKQWFMDRWDTHVATWQGWAAEAGMAVEFRYWGTHEIFARLSQEAHRGRSLFWFDALLFSDAWFAHRLKVAVENAGDRYSPELNVELPIAHLFDGLGRTPAFLLRLKRLHGAVKKAFTQSTHVQDTRLQTALEIAGKTANQLFSVLAAGSADASVADIDFPSITALASQLRSQAWDLAEEMQRLARDNREAFVPAQDAAQSPNEPKDYGYERHYLQELVRSLTSLLAFVESGEAQAANVAALLLRGEAGKGKTHLLCDVAQHRLAAGAPTLLLLGEQFNNEEPWSQITRQLGLSCSPEELLGALESAAQARGVKTLLLIDALNEGDGKRLWPKYIGGLLATVAGYAWVSIGLTVRSSYEKIVMPPHISEEKLVRETHHGFAQHEYQAAKKFFAIHGINLPSVPMLSPEFQDPLFLKLFCQGLKNKGLSEVPPGYHGITTIFSFLLDSVNEKLASEDRLDFDPNAQLVQKAMQRLAEEMAASGERWLSRPDAQALVNAFLPPSGYQNSLFRHLLAEGLLAEDHHWKADGESEDVVRFTYERFGDHMIGRHLLDRHLNDQTPEASFTAGTPLGDLVADEYACWRNRGLIEALSIQLPERIGKELAQVASASADYEAVRQSFVSTLVWRVPATITEETEAYINQHVLRYEDSQYAFLNALLTLAAHVDHPYNADLLDEYLRQFSLPDRDALWSVYLHAQYGEQGAVNSLVEWAWSSEDKSHIADEAIRLCATALIWFLTTSHRFLRDRATKALVSLLTPRMAVLRELVRRFRDVNDVYVLERVCAVAYGCALRSTDTQAIAHLAQDMYDWQFRDGTPTPHILLRDYARGVIETALHHDAGLPVEAKRIRPPYASEWPAHIPTEEEIRASGEHSGSTPDANRARAHLYNSIMGQEDFARYVIGTNFHRFDWTARRLPPSSKRSRKEIYQHFVASLNLKQKRAWKRYEDTREQVARLRRMGREERREAVGHALTDKNFDTILARFERRLYAVLSKRKRKAFAQSVIPFLADPHEEKDAFSLRLAQRWILQKVLDLGWTVERFGDFDRNINRYTSNYRAANKPERIGKKYQWIAWHEFLARVSDNFEYKGDTWNAHDARYEGPWQISRRDLDPSCLLTRTDREVWESNTQTWWSPVAYDAWAATIGDVDWLQSRQDVPAVEPQIAVTHPDGSEWLVLENHISWEQPVPPEEDRTEVARRSIWYMLKAYIVKRNEAAQLYDWARRQDFMGRWMPESHETYHVMLGEFFWAPAFLFHNVPYFHHEGWTRDTSDLLPVDVRIPTDQYFYESGGFDCSIEQTIGMHLPAKWLADGMYLRWNGVEGCYHDGSGTLIAHDPSIGQPGPSALVVRRDALLRFLEENDCDLVWTLLGEKMVYPGGFSTEHKGFLSISGAYRLHQGHVEGALACKFTGADS